MIMINSDYIEGGAAPDPLRSSSGATTGLPQSQSSSNIPSISSGTGYDAYGRPINAANIGIPSGYTSQGKATIIIHSQQVTTNSNE